MIVVGVAGGRGGGAGPENICILRVYLEWHKEVSHCKLPRLLILLPLNLKPHKPRPLSSKPVNP